MSKEKTIEAEILPVLPEPCQAVARRVQRIPFAERRMERQLKVAQLRARGVSPTAIAQQLNIPRCTVYRDLDALQKSYEEGVLKTPAIRLVIGMIMDLEEEARRTDESIAECQDITKTVMQRDANGEKSPVEYRMPDPNKPKYLQHKLNIIKAIQDLKKQFILPKDRDGLLHSAQESLGTAEDEKPEQHSEQEIIADIERLLRHGRRLTYAKNVTQDVSSVAKPEKA